MLKKLFGAAAAMAMVVGLLTMASPAWAACGLGANVPTDPGNNGKGSRTGCSTKVTLHVLVRKDVPRKPDRTAGQKKVSSFKNGSLWANGTCKYGRGKYFTETRSSTGNKIQSGRAKRC